MKRIGDILTRNKTAVEVEDGTSYKQVTIRTNYKGVVLRGTQDGSTILTKNQFAVSAGQFILSRIDARNGAFGIIPEELEGAIITNDFLAFDINEDEVEREFFNVFLQSPVFLEACIKASRGNTNRKRINETFFLDYEVNLPPLPEQHQLIKQINKARANLAIAQHEIAHQEALLGKLKQAILQEAIQGKLTADLPVRQAGWRDKSFINLSGKRVPEQSDRHFAYVLECSDQSLYKGMCQNLWERIDRHLAGCGSEWTAKHKPVALIHFDEFDTQEQARARECYFKSGSGREFLKLLHQERREAYEPASELLKRIQKEKAALTCPSGRRVADNLPAGKAGKLRPDLPAGKAGKPIPKISPAEIPFEIPTGWEWCRLGNIYTSTSGGTPARTNPSFWNGSISWLKSGEMTDDYITEPSEETITEIGLKNSSATLFPQGTLLIAMYGATAGKLGLLTYQSTTNQAVCGLFTHDLVETRFAFFYLRSQRSKMIEESWGNSQPNISQGYLRNYLIPLPPLAEQAAIVERVEALMENCRALETEIEHSRTHAAHLLQAVLKEAFSPASGTDDKVATGIQLQNRKRV